MDLKKLISRGWTINVLGNKLWIPLTFEKFSRICFECGRIIHGESNYREGRGSSNYSSSQYGPWLREIFNNRSGRKQANYGFQVSNSNGKFDWGGERKGTIEQPHVTTIGRSAYQNENLDRLDAWNRSNIANFSTYELVDPKIEQSRTTLKQQSNKGQLESKTKQTKRTSP